METDGGEEGGEEGAESGEVGVGQAEGFEGWEDIAGGCVVSMNVRQGGDSD